MDLTPVPDFPATRGMPRVVLADDHLVVLDALQGVLRTAATVVATATTGRGLVSAIAQKAPDLVIADLEMPDGTGLDALKHLRGQGNSTPFVVLSMHAKPAVVASCFRAGANGYLLKTDAGEELVTSIGLVLKGKTYVSPALAVPGAAGIGDPCYRATPRQLQILKLTALGLSTKKIGEQLALSPRTVEAHKFNLMNLLDAKTSLELVLRAQEAGLFF